jgi:Ser/Thr protein kinase RdoA (MazF antagonist)
MTGEWLRSFHKATADMPAPFDSEALVKELEKVCERCKSEGLDDDAIATMVNGARHVLAKAKKTLPSSAVLNDFTPLNVVVGEQGIGICDYAKMTARGTSLQDVAMFLASVEALEKYPFCNRNITQQIEEEFLDAYGVTASDMAVLRVLKMKILLGMFAHGRNVKESALRKKIMWANVMKKFIHQAAQRALAQPAA